MSETTTPPGVDATNFSAATDAQVQDGVALMFGVQAGTENTAKPQGLTVTPKQVAGLAVPAAAAQALTAAAAVPPVVLTAATALTAETHGGKTLVLQPGAAVTVDWTQTGNGFACLLLNRSGGPIAPALLGFTNPLPVNGNGEIAIPSPGAASILCVTPDGGTTTECWLVGDTAG